MQKIKQSASFLLILTLAMSQTTHCSNSSEDEDNTLALISLISIASVGSPSKSLSTQCTETLHAGVATSPVTLVFTPRPGTDAQGNGIGKFYAFTSATLTTGKSFILNSSATDLSTGDISAVPYASSNCSIVDQGFSGFDLTQFTGSVVRTTTSQTRAITANVTQIVAISVSGGTITSPPGDITARVQ